MLLYSACKINMTTLVCLQDLLLAACGKIGPQNEYSGRGKPSKDILLQKGKKRSIINRSHRYKVSGLNPQPRWFRVAIRVILKDATVSVVKEN